MSRDTNKYKYKKKGDINRRNRKQKKEKEKRNWGFKERKLCLNVSIVKKFLELTKHYKCIYFKSMKEEEQKQIKLNLSEKKEIIFRLLNQRT